jgi:K+-sensing histidine kinase KdpD
MSATEHTESVTRRAPAATLAAQVQLVSSSAAVTALMDAAPLPLLILNQHRQVLFANQHALKLLRWVPEQTLGKRLGELFRCEHAAQSTHGCGSSDACTVCGAVQAIQASLLGTAAVSECHIHGSDITESVDLRVSSSPIQLDDSQFTLVTLQDISHEHRRHNLERIFFHDLLNSVGALAGYAQLLQDAEPIEAEGLSSSILAQAENLAEEIRSQRDLLAAENGVLQLQVQEVNSHRIIQQLVAQYRSHASGRGREIAIGGDAVLADFRTDLRLLRRVLGNMLKNALEASRPGDCIGITCATGERDRLVFAVSNPQWIDRETQLRIFHRAFSTKGHGRGLGTYSMKLLGEKYLKGKIYFHSTPAAGTTFFAAVPITA